MTDSEKKTPATASFTEMDGGAPLALSRLESHHRRGTWDLLGLPGDIDRAWFQRVQNAACDRSPHTLHALLAHVYAVARRLPDHGGDVAAALAAAADAKRAACPVTLASTRRRMYRAVNFAWFDVHGALSCPVPVPPAVRTARDRPRLPVETRVFSAEEIQALVRVAADRCCTADRLLVSLLFTTGLRIGAVAAMQWNQVVDDAGCPRRVAYVREKGRTVRAVLLNSDVRKLFAELHRAHGIPNRPNAPVFRVGVRCLRTRFRAICALAGHRGEHCHPRPGPPFFPPPGRNADEEGPVPTALAIRWHTCCFRRATAWRSFQNFSAIDRWQPPTGATCALPSRR